MRLIDELFKKYYVVIDKLIPYGFSLNDGVYSLNKPIHNGDFSLQIKIKDGLIDGKLFDTNFGDEFNQINQEVSGSFIASLKEECSSILLDIRDNCFIKQYFIFPQTNRISNIIKEKYSVEPEFLWKIFPGYGVFRNQRTDKWFGIITNIPKSKIVGEDNIEIEALNLYLGNDALSLINNKGIYQSYHLNKKNWLSIILDDTLSDEEIMDIVDKSYQLIDQKGQWLIPANPKYYDVINIFKNSDIAIWKQSSHVFVGDIIYLYVAEPYKAIIFKCEVVEVDIPYEYKDKNVKMTKVMKIKLLKKYPDDKYTFDLLNQYGVKAIRGPRSVPEELINIL